MHNRDEYETTKEPDDRSSFVVVYVVRKLCLRFIGKSSFKAQIRWSAIAADMVARFFVGLVVGGGVCVLLIPAIFWPSRRNPHSLFEQISDKSWVGWLFGIILVVPAIIGALTSKLHLPIRGFQTKMSYYDEDDRVKIGCMGMLFPLALAAYGIHRILNPRKLNRFTGQLMERNEVVALGICALGLALLVHGWGFVPYERVPMLKYVVMIIGLAVFIYGLTWTNRGP